MMRVRKCLMRGLLAWVAASSAVGLTACAGAPQVIDYAQEKPQLSLRDFLQGTIDAQGVFTDRSGRVIKRFSVLMKASWQGPQGVLEEDFSYSDGTHQRRVWRLTDLGGGRFTGQADDVVGTAQGASAGNALNWRYTLALPVDGRVINVEFDDWMYQLDARTMLNKAVMSKWGFRLGEVTLFFTRR